MVVRLLAFIKPGTLYSTAKCSQTPQNDTDPSSKYLLGKKKKEKNTPRDRLREK